MPHRTGCEAGTLAGPSTRREEFGFGRDGIPIRSLPDGPKARGLRGGDLRAAEYLENRFLELGLTGVQRQAFACRAWSFDHCELTAVARGGLRRALPVLPYYYSPSTPAEGIDREWIYADSIEALEHAGDSAQGKVLLLHTETKRDAYSENVVASIITSSAAKTILLGVHYDTIPLPGAAGDNTAGMRK